MYRTLACLFLACALACGADAQPQAAFSLWDGHESVAQYAERTNLSPTKTLDLGNGVNLELVLIPAGKFIMGTPEPQAVNEGAFRAKIIIGQAVLAAGGGILVVLVGFAIVRAIRKKRRFQYSLRRFMAMAFAAGLCVLGGMHWWHSQRSLAVARAEYNAALVRYEEAGYWEKPAHEVTITKPFYMGKYEVTQEQYKAVTGSNPSSFKGAKNPVETVSWNGAQEFCKKLGEPTTGVSPVRMGTGGTPAVRLPTAAQWEYACRAGTRTRFCSGDRDSDLDGVGWYGGNSGKTTHPVGLKTANNWGLYDMHGNVWEWCQDWAEDYRGAAATDPLGAGNGTYCVTRGGSWRDSPRICRSAIWYKCIPDPHNFDTGFRVIVEVLARTP